MLLDLHMSRKFKSILEQCIAGERKAQRVLFQELRGKLMGICYRYSNNTDDAQDIFQEVMIKIFQNIERGTEMDNFLGWAGRITINTAIDYYKKNRASLFVELDNAVDFYFSDDQITIFQSMENDEILQLLATLPENQRIVFNLYIIEGYSHKEIANKLSLAESTSRALLTRAKQKLVALLKKRECYEKVFG